MSIELAAYSPDWPQQFCHLADGLRSSLRTVPLVAVEHIGSTAVPGLCAKPIVDVDIIVRREWMNAGKSAVFQEVLAASDLTAEEKRQIYELNNPT